jgi:lysophospholipid acyltransferase (LPLAT)-like uncharacterized protein
MHRVVPRLGAAGVRLLDASWRYVETDHEHYERARAHGPLAGAFLHGHTFMLLAFMSRRRKGRWLLMCSKSLDGEAMARTEERLGYEVVRGSSGGGGLQAIVDMIRRVRSDRTLGASLAVDGSRGPRGRVQPGIVSLAQHTGGLILPVAASAQPLHVFRNSWDLTRLPWPGATVQVVYGAPIEVPPRPGAAGLERVRALVEERLRALQARADQLSGLSGRQAAGGRPGLKPLPRLRYHGRRPLSRGQKLKSEEISR